MGKTTRKTGSKKTKSTASATPKVSWRTLSRQAASLEQKHGHPTAKSKSLRTQASEQRRLEREKAGIKKARRPAKKATTARRKPRKDTLKGLAHLTVDQANAVLDQAVTDANNAVPLTYSPAEHHKAIFDAIEGAVHRANDNIVCSLIAMYRDVRSIDYMPWKVEGETMRALIEVLDRAGYTAFGRKKFETAPVASEVGKAS